MTTSLGSRCIISTNVTNLDFSTPEQVQVNGLFRNMLRTRKRTHYTTTLAGYSSKRHFVPQIALYTTASFEGALSRIQRAVQQDARHSITFQEFVDLCHKEAGATRADAVEFSNRLNTAGEIVHTPGSSDPVLADTVILVKKNNHRTADRLDNALLLDGQVLEQFEGLQKELAQRKSELHQYNTQYNNLKSRAQRSVKRTLWGGLVYLCVQMGVLMRFVWWDFQWDIIEPFTYVVTFVTMLLGYLYFATTKREYTYDHLTDRLVARKLNRLVKRSGFDMYKYEDIKRKVETLEKEINDHPLSRPSHPMQF